MSSFLSISENQQLSDGSQNIYVRNCRIKNIDNSAIVKTTSNNTLIGVQEITIGEVSGLQTALNNTLSATMNQTLNMNGFNITNANNISGQAGNSTITISDENINIQGSTSSIIGTATGFVRLNAFDTILTTTGVNAVQCLRALDMKNNDIQNVNNVLVSEITSSNITGSIIVNSDFKLGDIHNIYGVNDLTANNIETQGNIYLYKSISPEIYVNASLMRQTQQIIYNGAALTPAGGNTFQFAPSFIPTATASNISGTAFIPGNTMAVGNTFKLTCYGTIQEGNNGIIQNFRLYALNTTTISAVQLISVNNQELVTIVSRWRLDIVFQIRAVGVNASMVINGDLAIGNTNQSITNTTVNFDSTAGQQLIGTIYYDTNNSSNNFTTDITSLRTL
jgi:hypothetical protein